MKCDGLNGYAGWKVCEKVTNQQEVWALWADPDANTYATMDQPPRVLATGEMAHTVHKVKDITVDVLSCTFWIERLAVTVAPLSRGRQGPKEPSNKPCEACRQPETCKRIDYCAAYRCRFGHVDAP